MKNGFSIAISPVDIKINSFLSNNYDDLYFQSESFDFLLEGVLLNKRKLLQEFALKDFQTLIQKLYEQKKSDIIKEFEGEYRGFIYDKVENKLFAFTNVTSTQRIFYGKFENSIYIDTSLIRLNERLKQVEIKSQPDLDSLYQLLCFGGLLERATVIENVQKVLDGHYLEINLQTSELTEVQYFTLNNKSVFNRSKKDAYQEIHEIFTESVLMEYAKDDEFETDHLALLSGGLDSRVAVMYAINNRRKPDNLLCFSQSGYYDETISRKIARDYEINYEFIPLDGGKFLKRIDELTAISEGLVLHTGGIHVWHAVENMEFENFSLFHSGQLGDAILGGYLSTPSKISPTNFKIVDHPSFLNKVEATLNEVKMKYESEESFLLRNRGFNMVLLGAHVFQQKRYQTSPFMTKDFLSFASSLPEEWKFNHRFYIEWINKHCVEATNYRWERTLMKPNAAWKTSFGDKVMKRSFNILNNKILKTPQNASMYPYQFYYDNDAQIQNYYQNYFDENIHRLENYKELSADVFALFKKNSFSSKSKAINILAIFKLYF